MVTTAEALEALYPNAVPLADYTVQDDRDGEGQYIAAWNPALGPEPTQAQLDAVTEQQVTDARKAKEPDVNDFHDRVPGMIADHDAYLALADPTQNQLERQITDLTQNQKRIIKAVDRLGQQLQANPPGG